MLAVPISTGSSGMASTCPNPQQFLILMLHARPRVWQGRTPKPPLPWSRRKGNLGSRADLLLTGVQVLLLAEKGKTQWFGPGFTVPHLW